MISMQFVTLSIWKEFITNEGVVLQAELRNFPVLIGKRLIVSYFNGLSRIGRQLKIVVTAGGSSKQSTQILIPASTTVTPVANILPAQKTALVKATISFKEIFQKHHYMACKKCFHTTTVAYHYDYTCNTCGEKQIAEPSHFDRQ